MVEGYRDLRIWQESILLAKQVYMLAEALPDKERYGLRSQITRAAVSVASNIAEGSCRRGTNDLLQFLSVALGSLAELETQCIIGKEVGFFTEAAVTPILEQTETIARGIVKLRQTLEKRQ